MFSVIADELTGKLSDQWSSLLLPAALFWLLGVAMWLGNSPAMPPDITEIGQGTWPWTKIVVSSVIVLASVTLVRSVEFKVLRQLEGYWPPLSNRFKKGVEKQQQRAKEIRAQLDDLFNAEAENKLSAEGRRRRVELDLQYRRYPTEAIDFLPTTLGNVLRSAERWPRTKYGLDPIYCWHHLWLVMPAESRAATAGALTAVELGVRFLIWSVLSLLWVVVALVAGWWKWTWLPFVPIPVAIVGVSLSYWWTLRSARSYGDLFEAVFDIHRRDLYRALGVPVPTNPKDERAVGESLNVYLFRGLDDPQFRLTTDKCE